MTKNLFISGVLLVCLMVTFVTPLKLLVFTKTSAYRHDSAIAAGIQMFKDFADQKNYQITFSEDSEAIFGEGQTPEKLAAAYDVIVFMHTTGNLVLSTETQKNNFKGYIEMGNQGFVGIHAASDGMYNWEWYGGELVGGFFTHHPAPQEAVITIEQINHPIMKDTYELLKSNKWTRTDEWYQFDRNPRNTGLKNIVILATVDESTYSGGDMGADHPLVWCHEMKVPDTNPTKVFYTALGHTDASYSDEAYIAHIIAGIEWVAAGSDEENTPSDPEDTISQEGSSSPAVSSTPVVPAISSSKPVQSTSTDPRLSDRVESETSNSHITSVSYLVTLSAVAIIGILSVFIPIL